MSSEKLAPALTGIRLSMHLRLIGSRVQGWARVVYVMNQAKLVWSSFGRLFDSVGPVLKLLLTPKP